MSFASTWMAWYGDDFWESERVASMDDSAALLYAWLLWRQFKRGPLPPPDVLRRLPHRWTSRWDRVWPQVSNCFVVLEDGHMENERCRDIRADAVGRAERASVNGKRGGRPKGSPAKPRANPGLSVSVSQTEPDANPDQSSDQIRHNRTDKDPTGLPPTPTALKRLSPPEVDWSEHPTLDSPAMRLAWGTWVSHRRELRVKPYTSQGLAQALAKLAELGPDRALLAIQHSIAGNYQGIFEPRNDASRPGANGHAHGGGTSMRALLDAERNGPRPIDVKGERVA